MGFKERTATHHKVLLVGVVAVLAITGVGVAGYALSNKGTAQVNNTKEFDQSYMAATVSFQDSLVSALDTAKTNAGNTAAVTGFEAAYNGAKGTFNTSVKNAEHDFDAAIAKLLSSDMAKDQLIAAYSAARDDYFSKLNQAKDLFNQTIDEHGGSQEAKNAFADAFNHALADYGNSLEAAKNAFADRVNHGIVGPPAGSVVI